MKRAVIFFITCIMLASMSCVESTVFAKTSGNFEYEVTEDNTATITGYSGGENDLVIPEVLDGYTVKKLDDFAFTDNKNLKSVELNASLAEIGIGCFQFCEKLEKVKFNGKLKKIEYAAFKMTGLKTVDLPDSITDLNGFEYTKIKNIKIPASVKTIGTFCFWNCPLTKVNFNNKLETIESYAFCGCESLEKIKLPKSLKTIESDAFCHANISSINIPEKVTNIGIDGSDFGVFSETLEKITVSKNNKKFSAKNGILYNKKKTELVYYPPYRLRATFKTPTYIKSIGEAAFNRAPIGTVTVTGNVKTVKKKAFVYADIKKVVFKKGVKTIGKYAFDSSEIIEVKLPKGLKRIADSTFSASSLRKVNIPKSVKSIGEEAFFGTDIKKITVPATVKKIGKYAIGIKYGECGSYGGVDKNTVIRCKKNSAAHKYAKKYKVRYKLI